MSSNPAMRMLFLSHVPNNPNGGASRIYHLLADNLRSRGHDVTLLHLEDFGMPKQRHLEVLLRRVALPRFVSSGGRKAGPENFDVIMASSGTSGPLFRSLHAKPSRPLLVNHIHGLTVFDHLSNLHEATLKHWPVSLPYRLVTGPFQVRWDNEVLPVSDVVVVQNLRDLAEVRKHASASTMVEFIPAALAPEFTGTFDTLDQAGQTKVGNKLLWFATWEARKGSSYVPAAFRELRTARPDLTLTIGGTGKSAEEIRDYFDPRDRQAVNVLGRISLDEQVAVFGSHDVFLFPSLSEGFGLALLEAMANGLPAVTTPTGFGADYCENEKNAMVVAPNAVAIARAVERLLADPALAARVAKAGRELARTFTIDRMAAHYESAFVAGIDRKASR